MPRRGCTGQLANAVVDLGEYHICDIILGLFVLPASLFLCLLPSGCDLLS